MPRVRTPWEAATSATRVGRERTGKSVSPARPSARARTHETARTRSVASVVNRRNRQVESREPGAKIGHDTLSRRGPWQTTALERAGGRCGAELPDPLSAPGRRDG